MKSEELIAKFESRWNIHPGKKHEGDDERCTTFFAEAFRKTDRKCVCTNQKISPDNKNHGLARNVEEVNARLAQCIEELETFEALPLLDQVEEILSKNRDLCDSDRDLCIRNLFLVLKSRR